MRYWIEISSEYRFQKKVSNLEGLYAPASTRYKNMLKEVNKDDIVLHYITGYLAIKKEHKSTIIGVSIVKSKMNILDKKLNIDLGTPIIIPIPIHISEIKEITEKSFLLKKFLGFNFQRYLGEILAEDFFQILNIHPENLQFFNNYKEENRGIAC
ncbi:MAG: hypothetical protein AMJ90_06910 [candidate division Zixibacteria bacterium SM23_73_2]|nr:MAG: hypothetical protein AMJ90_06910 [candidate division Zixibacteria bacterium SM23_73_2]